MSDDSSVAPSDVRFGHNLASIQDQNGVDVSLLRSNLRLSVQERLMALEDYLQFVDAVRTVNGTR